MSNNVNLVKFYRDINKPTIVHKAHRFLLKIRNRITELPNFCNVIEFGVADGVSTAVFAEIIEKRNGRLISLDIKDCSKVISGWSGWTFMKCDDRNYTEVYNQTKISNFDLIYVDSFCHNVDAYEHMNELFEIWMPKLNKNGYMVIHGVDPRPYEKGGRKEDSSKAKMYTKVFKAIKDFYYKNEEKYDLEVCMGSVGMAFLKKLV